MTKKKTALNDSAWDAEELKQWTQKVALVFKERVIRTNWEALSFQVPVIPEVSDRSTFSPLEKRCTDLSGNLMSEKEAFLELASELGAKEPLTFDFEEVLRSASPSPPPKFASPVLETHDAAN